MITIACSCASSVSLYSARRCAGASAARRPRCRSSTSPGCRRPRPARASGRSTRRGASGRTRRATRRTRCAATRASPSRPPRATLDVALLRALVRVDRHDELDALRLDRVHARDDDLALEAVGRVGLVRLLEASVLMPSKHFGRCGCTASGFLDCARISSSSSFERKKKRGKASRLRSRYSLSPFWIFSRKRLASLSFFHSSGALHTRSAFACAASAIVLRQARRRR